MDRFEMTKRFVCQENAAKTASVRSQDAYEVGYLNGIRAVHRFIYSIDYEED